MPPEPIALDSPDEDERRYPLRSDRRKPKREHESDSEVDELESDNDDDPQSCSAPPTRKSPVRSTKPKSARKLKKERHQAKKKKKKQQREAREAREKNDAIAAESAPGPVPQPCDGDDVDEDDDEHLPGLVVPSKDARRKSPVERVTETRSEDEVELIASEPPGPETASVPPERSSAPITVDDDTDKRPPDSAASAPPTIADSRADSAPAPGDVSNPVAFETSSPPMAANNEAADDVPDDASVSDISSLTYSDSEECVEGEEFYTSSEGSQHGSDSEDGLGSWTKRDQDKWQGSTAHLDAAYDDVYEVRAVLRHRRNPRRGFMQYRTVWAGYPIYSTTWEPESHFNSRRTLDEYWQRQGGRPADAPYDPANHSTHDSDTDRAVIRRPRRRAHEALKKKRREIRRDKVDLRKYMASLDHERAEKKAKAERKFELWRREKRVELETERTREKGTSRSHQKRLEKLNKKRWKRAGGADGAGAAASARFSATHANRSMADISMKARAGPSVSARTRVSQLDDSIPENDDNQLVFRKSAPGSGSNYPGLAASMPGPSRSRPGSTSVRPIAGPSSASRPATASGSASGSNSQAPPPRPPPGSYKGQHHRGPRVQIKEDMHSFLNKLHSDVARSRAAQDGNSQAVPAPTDSDGRPIAMKRRPSEAKRSNLLVLQPVKDFQGGSRPAAPASVAHASHSTSSEAGDDGDNEPLDIPEMSAVRGQFNPHQPAPDSDEERKRASVPKRSSLAPPAPQQKAKQTEDPRRRLNPPSAPKRDQHASWSPPADDAGWNPSGWDMDPGPAFSPPTLTPRSPLEGEFRQHGHGAPRAPAPQSVVTHCWFQIVTDGTLGLEGTLCSHEPFPSNRAETLGLADRVTIQFDRVMPFAWIREALAGPDIAWHEAMVLHAQGPGVIRNRAHLDHLSERLKVTDMALLSALPSPRASVNAEGSAQQQEYLVAFSNKYSLDPVAGVPQALQNISGHSSTLCVMPLRLSLVSAPSQLLAFRRQPPLDSSIASIFDIAVGKRSIEDIKIGRSEVRKVKRAAQRYGIVPALYEGIRSRFNVLFLGHNPPAYEKRVLYYMIRIFEGGVRLMLDEEKDAKLYKDPKIGVNVFVRNAALKEILSTDQEQELVLAAYLRRFKRVQRCQFWTFGFSPEDPDERIRELFPGHSGLVSFSMSAILADLVRSCTEEKQSQDSEEGQLTQQTEKGLQESILCNTQDHLPSHWRVRLHPWIRPCFRLLADHLEPVCRALNLIGEEDEFPIELFLELDAKLEAVYTAAWVEEWPGDAIHGLPFEEPSELPDEPEALIKQMDEEVFASLRDNQLTSIRDTRFHVMVSGSQAADERGETELAGVEVVSLADFGKNVCSKLAAFPGN
ncbi:uncharacterized protein PSANT_00430 [Moesziomyces antarcticus]|uniref:Chromo domain-containing protein n=1 Tax=Pseudozyma antarctica TaxID=84753 RepID=A0A5C3FGB2_PSEA2|nr:uncharacterized protein PSANT_00430 [Moesziomyces antarcticus]